jgi:hypothetical protein
MREIALIAIPEMREIERWAFMFVKRKVRESERNVIAMRGLILGAKMFKDEARHFPHPNKIE